MKEPGKLFKTVPRYKMVYEDFAKSQALNSELELCERLWWLAMWWAKPNGHATFQPGEIETTLGVQTRALNKALVKAKARNQLHPMSSRRCLVLPALLDGKPAIGNNRGGNAKFNQCAHCVGASPQPKTSATLRDYESEAALKESYSREMKVQAREVLREPAVPEAGTSSSRRRSEAPDGNTEDDRQPDTVTLDDTEVAMPQADTIEVDPIVWFTEYLSNGPVESIKFSTDCKAMGFESTDFPVDRFGLATIDGTVHVEDLWNRQQSDLALSAASEQA